MTMKLFLLLVLLLLVSCRPFRNGLPGQCHTLGQSFTWLNRKYCLTPGDLRDVADGTRVFDGDPEPKFPRDPDATLEGVDSDKDGVRDDVEAYINELFKTYNQRMAWKNYARKTQDFLLNGGLDKMRNRDISFFCVQLVYGFTVGDPPFVHERSIKRFYFLSREREVRNESNVHTILMNNPGLSLHRDEDNQLKKRFAACPFEVQNQEELRKIINASPWLKGIKGSGRRERKGYGTPSTFEF
ncbi:MAG: hypothetical protein HYV97_01020 [Bdellovibrio sp.]|nr:hypothetical protein [Bdellovibrio sp.]